MKRHAIAFLIHPYKNPLIPKAMFREAINSFAQTIIDIGASYQNLRWNLVLPGYFLESIDPMLLLPLRELHKKGQIEWLTTGYTEPFLSFSPKWLLAENLKHGLATFQEYTGVRPSGFVPPFSNWEPSYIDTLRNASFNYSVLSRSLLSPQFRSRLGYWATEFAGSSTVFFPVHSVAPETITGNMEAWIEEQFVLDKSASQQTKLLCIDFLCPILSQNISSTEDAIRQAARVFDKLLLTYQSIRFTEFLSGNAPLGLQYIPQNIVFRRDDTDTEPNFLNSLHSYDQIGVIQRKMMDVADNIASRKESKHNEPFKKTLFFVQDINRYIPSRTSGYTLLHDRIWCFDKLIGIERDLRERDKASGGQIRIADFLRNGSKSIVMTNKNLAVYMDYKNGGQIFEIDVRRRRFNVCAAYNPARHSMPIVCEPGLSYTAFVDHCVPPQTTAEDFRQKKFTELGDFYNNAFDYKIKKTEAGIKAALNRQGSIVLGDKTCPLSLEKVLGLEKDSPALPFVYQFSNHSLTPYSYMLIIEFTFALPGIAADSATLLCKKEKHRSLSKEMLTLSDVSQWYLSDPDSGVGIQCTLQKPVDLWCYPVATETEGTKPEAITIALAAPVALEGSSVWSIMGKLQFKRVGLSKKIVDEI